MQRDCMYGISWQKQNHGHFTTNIYDAEAGSGWEGISLQSDVKPVFHVAPEHCRFKLFDIERLASSVLSDPRNEQVVTVFVCWHL